MKIEGRSISPGKAEGVVLIISEPLSFLGGVDGATGDVRVGNGGNVAGKVLVFPKGKGSTVGSFVMYDLMVHGKQPAAVINESAETIVATGAVISSIPMIDQVPSIDLFEDGDIVRVDADSGTAYIDGVQEAEAAVMALCRDGKVLLRSGEAERSLPCRRAESSDPSDVARKLASEVLGTGTWSMMKAAPPVYFREGKTVWKVHPFLFEASGDSAFGKGLEWADIQSVELCDRDAAVLKLLLKP